MDFEIGCIAPEIHHLTDVVMALRFKDQDVASFRTQTSKNTERDVLMKVAGQPTDLEHTAVSQVMTVDPVTLPVDATVAFALNKMLIEGFRHIPLINDQNRPVAVVSMRDLIDYLSDFFKPEILNLPPDPRAGFRSRDGA